MNKFSKPKSPTPIILASEGAECGLACLAMIARHWGHDIDLTSLRLRFPMSLSGVTVRNIIAMASELALSSRAIRVELSSLQHLSLPAIAHWNFNHFVVITGVSKNFVLIHDPASGVKRLRFEEFSEQFTGIALEFERAENFEPVSSRARVQVRGLWSGIIGLKFAALHIFILSVMSQFFMLLLPFQVQLVIDHAVSARDNRLSLAIAAGFMCIALLQISSEYLRNVAIQSVGIMSTYHVAGNVVRHLLRLPVGFFERRNLGDILSRISSIRSLQEIVTSGFVSALIDGLIAMCALVILLKYSVVVCMLCAACTVLAITVSLAFYPAMRERAERRLAAGAQEQTYLMESIRAITTIRLLGGEAEREATWRNVFSRATRASLSASKVEFAQISSSRTIAAAQGVIVLAVAAGAVIAGEISIGMLFVCVTFGQMFTDRVMSLVNQTLKFRLLGLHIERISDLVATPVESNDVLASSALENIVDIEFDNVSFRYGHADAYVLKQISLKIQAGDYIAITGPSGAGKSTLLKILTGLTAPSHGAVLMDGRSVTNADWRRWRSQAGIVTQADSLLSGSIADNISFFDPDATKEKIESAARLACIHDDIISRPMQYLSLIGDMGSTLSAGQRQRILLARAFYRKPRYLILDEGTANLDYETERAIATNIRTLGVTVIAVSHRPALIEIADKVFEIKNGSIAKAPGLCKELCR